jgi:hypothetical protein
MEVSIMTESDFQKTVHMVRCPFCNGYHRVRLKLTSFGDPPSPPPEILQEMFRSANESMETNPTECPVTNRPFTPDKHDWLHLTEEEFHRRYPGNRRM